MHWGGDNDQKYGTLMIIFCDHNVGKTLYSKVFIIKVGLYLDRSD